MKPRLSVGESTGPSESIRSLEEGRGSLLKVGLNDDSFESLYNSASPWREDFLFLVSTKFDNWSLGTGIIPAYNASDAASTPVYFPSSPNSV